MKCSIVISVLVVVAMAVCGGCALHTQTSVGMGSAAPYAASMSRGRGVGIDYGPDVQYDAHSDHQNKTVNESHTSKSEKYSARD